MKIRGASLFLWSQDTGICAATIGHKLMQRWNGSTRAHRTVAVPSFQNFWKLEGPTGPVGNLSLNSIIEHQVDYIISMLDRMNADGLAAIAARASAFEDYNMAMREAIKSTAWYTVGRNSWYIDKSGLPSLYPWFPCALSQG